MRGGAVGVLRLSSLAGVSQSKCVIPAARARMPRRRGSRSPGIGPDRNSRPIRSGPSRSGVTGMTPHHDHRRSEEPHGPSGRRGRTRRNLCRNHDVLRISVRSGGFSACTLEQSRVSPIRADRGAPPGSRVRPVSMFASDAASEDGLEAALIASARAICSDGAAGRHWDVPLGWDRLVARDFARPCALTQTSRPSRSARSSVTNTRTPKRSQRTSRRTTRV